MVFQDLVPLYMAYLPENIHLRAIIILITFFLLSYILVWIFEKIVLRLTAKTKTEVDDLIIKRINKPISLILLLYGVRLAIESYHLPENTELSVERVIFSLIILCIAFIITGILIVLLDNWGMKMAAKTKSDFDDAVLPLVKRFIYIVALILALIYILDYWSVEVGPLLASLGVAGIAVAFAMQQSLGNIFGGISMILDKSIKAGDWVKIDSGSQGQVTGVVMDVGLRSTKIKTFDNEVLIMPNGVLSNSQIQNLALPDPKARCLIEFGVEYGSDVDKVKKIAMDSMKGIDGISKDPKPFCYFNNMGDFALQFRLYFFVDSFTLRFTRKELVRSALYKNLNKAKIGIPYPTRTVFLKK